MSVCRWGLGVGTRRRVPLIEVLRADRGSWSLERALKPSVTPWDSGGHGVPVPSIT